MNPRETERIALTVECFFNAARVADGPERTRQEAWLVQWFIAERAHKAYAVIHRGEVTCHAPGGRVVQRRALPPGQSPTLWCDGRKISALDGQAWSREGRLLMLGTAGLVMTLPGQTAAGQKPSKQNNNNNNNNNNNG